jgi:chromosome segregation ATPase
LNRDLGLLDLPGVIESYREAQTQLTAVAASIRKISDHESMLSSSAASVSDAAIALKSFVSSIEEACLEIGNAVASAQATLGAGAALLDSAALANIEKQLKALSESLRELGGTSVRNSDAVAALRADLPEQYSKIHEASTKLIMGRVESESRSRSSEIQRIEAGIENLANGIESIADRSLQASQELATETRRDVAAVDSLIRQIDDRLENTAMAIGRLFLIVVANAVGVAALSAILLIALMSGRG